MNTKAITLKSYEQSNNTGFLAVNFSFSKHYDTIHKSIFCFQPCTGELFFPYSFQESFDAWKAQERPSKCSK